MNTIKDLVTNKHRIYRQYYNFWNFLLDSYEGGIDYTQSKVDTSITDGIEVRVNNKAIGGSQVCNLFKHPKERDQDYAKRVEMSYYYNFCAPIIEIYTNHLFKEPVVEDFDGIDPRTIEAVGEDIDRMGSSIGEFRKLVADMAQVFGHIFVLCDKPNIEGRRIITVKDKMDVRLFPYFVLYRPQDVVNWALDNFGRPYWVLLQEDNDSNVDPFQVNVKPTTRVYRLWTREEWIVYNSEYVETARGYHGLNSVPIECVFDRKSLKAKNFLGISALADVALIARDVYNSCSELKQILRDQTFAFLALQGDSSEYNELTVGTGKGLLYPPDRAVPQYVSPPSSNAQVYFDHIDRQISKMFQLAKLEGGSAEFKGQSAVQQSGVSKAWDFNQTNSALSKKADNLEDGETKLWHLFAKQDGGEFKGFVNYPQEFSVKSLMDDLTEAEALAKVQLGKTFMFEVKKAIIHKKFPRVPEDKIAEMENEVTALPEEQQGNGSLRSRIPFLFKQDANSGGKNGGGNDGAAVKI